jgi:hypothetical protein
MRDLTIKLAGACTEITACIFTNSFNVPSGDRDERYPENWYVNYCSTSNITLVGTYGLAYDGDYQYLPEEALTYRGVGIYGRHYFLYYDSDGLICRKLYAGIYEGGGGNNYRIYVPDSRFAVYGGGTNNIFDICGHASYGYGRDGQRVIATDYIFYGMRADTNSITIRCYDTQWSKGLLYFDTYSMHNHYIITPSASGMSTAATIDQGNRYSRVVDYGRANIEIQPTKEYFVGIGSYLSTITGLPCWNT